MTSKYMKDPITQAELAKRAGVSKTSARKLFKGKWEHIVVDKWVDAKDPRVAEYINEKLGIKTRAKPVAKPAVVKAAKPLANDEPTQIEAPAVLPSDTILASSPADIEKLEQMTVKEIGVRFGTIEGFRKFVEIMKLTADYKYREIKNESERGTLVDRETVRGVVFPLVDTAFARLVSDVPTTLAPLVAARVQSGGENMITEVEELIRAANSKVLKNTKQQVRKCKVLKK